MSWHVNPLLGYWARGLQNPTKAEAALEPAIAKLGERYRCQHLFPGLKYIADFAILTWKLIIEVDGDSHETPAQKEKDLLHTLAVLKLGWNVVRVTNEQVLQNPEKTVDAALRVAALLPDKESRVQELTAQLEQLRQNHPGLLSEGAKRSRKKSQSSRAAARTRRDRAKATVASKASGGRSPRKRAVVVPPLA